MSSDAASRGACVEHFVTLQDADSTTGLESGKDVPIYYARGCAPPDAQNTARFRFLRSWSGPADACLSQPFHSFTGCTGTERCSIGFHVCVRWTKPRKRSAYQSPNGYTLPAASIASEEEAAEADGYAAAVIADILTTKLARLDARNTDCVAGVHAIASRREAFITFKTLRGAVGFTRLLQKHGAETPAVAAGGCRGSESEASDDLEQLCRMDWSLAGHWDVPHSRDKSAGHALSASAAAAAGGASLDGPPAAGEPRPRSRLSVFRLSAKRVAAALPSFGESLPALLSPLRDALGPEVRVRGVPGLFLLRGFVSEEEEQALARAMDGDGGEGGGGGSLWDSTMSRRVCHFGARFDYVSRGIAAGDVRARAGRAPLPGDRCTSAMPALLQSVCRRAEAACRALAACEAPGGARALRAAAASGEGDYEGDKASARPGAGQLNAPVDPWLVPTWDHASASSSTSTPRTAATWGNAQSSEHAERQAAHARDAAAGARAMHGANEAAMARTADASPGTGVPASDTAASTDAGPASGGHWRFDQSTANEYLPGQGISAHTDTPGAFGPFLCSLSLLSDTVMELAPPAADLAGKRPVVLPRRSLLVMTGPSRYEWTHAIAPRERDRVGASLVPRSRRISLTLRQVAWAAAMDELDGRAGGATKAPDRLFSPSLQDEAGAGTGARGGSEGGAAVLRTPESERVGVHAFYDAVAPHFSETRSAGRAGSQAARGQGKGNSKAGGEGGGKRRGGNALGGWPRVLDFMRRLRPLSLVVDAGCGNGRYILSAQALAKEERGGGAEGGKPGFPQLVCAGFDRSAGLVELAGKAGEEAGLRAQVGVADALVLPWRGGTADAAMSIAVLHHISTRARRVRLMFEIGRILRVGGAALVQAWALEQPKGSAVYRRFEKLGCFAEARAGAGARAGAETGSKQGKDTFVPWKLPPDLALAAQAAREGIQLAKAGDGDGDKSGDAGPSTGAGAGTGAGAPAKSSPVAQGISVAQGTSASGASEAGVDGKEEDPVAAARQAAALREARAQEDGGAGSLVLQRFCHLFVRGELEDLVAGVNEQVVRLTRGGAGGDGDGAGEGRAGRGPDRASAEGGRMGEDGAGWALVVRESWYERGNWCVRLEKVRVGGTSSSPGGGEEEGEKTPGAWCCNSEEAGLRDLALAEGVSVDGPV